MYCTTDYIQTKFAGRFNFGSSGTCLMGTAQAVSIINTITNYIDMECADVYGTVTPLFGTNSWGTSSLALVIQDICADLSMGMMFKNTVLSITDKQNNWADEIYGRGTEWLGNVSSNLWSVAGFNGTILTANPLVSGGEVNVYGEQINFNGTNLVNFNNHTVINNSVKVYGTQLLNPVIYRNGIDYKYWAYNTALQGSSCGFIASLGTVGVASGTGSISGTFPAFVDYSYKVLPNFRLNDTVKWGLPHRENRG